MAKFELYHVDEEPDETEPTYVESNEAAMKCYIDWCVNEPKNWIVFHHCGGWCTAYEFQSNPAIFDKGAWLAGKKIKVIIPEDEGEPKKYFK